jgi:hypothetical protein
MLRLWYHVTGTLSVDTKSSESREKSATYQSARAPEHYGHKNTRTPECQNSRIPEYTNNGPPEHQHIKTHETVERALVQTCMSKCACRASGHHVIDDNVAVFASHCMSEMNIDRLQQQELLPIQLYSVLVGNINDQTVIVVFL